MAIHTFTRDGLKVEVTLTSEAESWIADQVVSVDDWCKGFADMIFAKARNSLKRMVDTEIQRLREAGQPLDLTGTDKQIAEAVLTRPGYKNRAEREAEAGAM